MFSKNRLQVVFYSVLVNTGKLAIRTFGVAFLEKPSLNKHSVYEYVYGQGPSTFFKPSILNFINLNFGPHSFIQISVRNICALTVKYNVNLVYIEINQYESNSMILKCCSINHSATRFLEITIRFKTLKMSNINHFTQGNLWKQANIFIFKAVCILGIFTLPSVFSLHILL